MDTFYDKRGPFDTGKERSLKKKGTLAAAVKKVGVARAP